MARRNEEVAAALREYGDLATITGGERDSFKLRAYDKAARAVEAHPADLSDPDAIGKIPGVGSSIAGKIQEYLRTGSFRQLDELRAKIPPGVRELTRISSLGPRKALMLYRELGVASVADLVQAINAGKLRDLKGFGAKSEEKLLAAVDLKKQTTERVLLPVALRLAEQIVEALSVVPGCRRCAYAGSLRRGRETVRDIDILAAAVDAEPVMAAFGELPQVSAVVARGPTKFSVRTWDGLQVDLRVVPPECWGAALQYFTGSKEHNVRIRELAVRAGLKLSEYGLFDAESGELLVAETEEEVYARLGMAWIPAQLREDRGEVAAALAGALPELVDVADLRGDLHTHTDLTDGRATLEEMVAAAAARGYAYYAVTDHAPDLVMQRMTLDKARAQRHAVAALQDRYPRLRLLHGSELNIGPDGEVDWPGEVLAEFDVCVASVHSHFGQTREEMTRRFIRACENPYVHVIGHPTARRLGRRAAVDVDLDAVFQAAARTGTALEVNGGPERLDLRDEHVRWAQRYGVRFAVDSDAHSVSELDQVRYAATSAQRGWLGPADVINTWPLDRLTEFIRVKADSVQR